jgi:hypothetical protein
LILMHDTARVAEVAAVEVLVEKLLHVERLVASVELGGVAVLIAGVERPARRTTRHGWGRRVTTPSDSAWGGGAREEMPNRQ